MTTLAPKVITLVFAVLSITAPCICFALPTSEDTTPLEYVRILREDEKPVSFQVATQSFSKSTPYPHRVHLVGAIHVGDAGYYYTLNKLFEEYDVVLYELVAEEGQKPVVDEDGGRGELYAALAPVKNYLKLEHQLDGIDYEVENFVHADLSFEQMFEAQQSNGSSPRTVLLELLVEVLTTQQTFENSQEPELRFLYSLPQQAQALSVASTLADPLAFRVLFAAIMAESTRLDTMAQGDTLFSFFVGDRNTRVLEVLEEQLAKKPKDIGVFYGAGHMKDLSERLIELGYQHSETTWTDAWDLRAAIDTQNPISRLFKAFKKRGEKTP